MMVSEWSSKFGRVVSWILVEMLIDDTLLPGGTQVAGKTILTFFSPLQHFKILTIHLILTKKKKKKNLEYEEMSKAGKRVVTSLKHLDSGYGSL